MKINIKDTEYSSELEGYILTLDDDRIVQIQFDKVTDKLNANYGEYCAVIDRQNEYGLNITQEEEEQIMNFVEKFITPNYIIEGVD